jgi:hypothetical protein
MTEDLIPLNGNSEITLDDILTELKRDYNVSQENINVGFWNADQVIDFVVYMNDIKEDDYKFIGRLMRVFYTEYFNNIADECYLLKNKCKKQHRNIEFEIEPITINADTKKDIIETLGPYVSEDKKRAFYILYGVMNNDTSDGENESGTKQQP